MTDDSARRIAADYLAALDDREAAAFVAEARNAEAEARNFARALFAPDPTERDRWAGLFGGRNNPSTND